MFLENQTRPNIHINDLVRLYDFFFKKNIKSDFAMLVLKIEDNKDS